MTGFQEFLLVAHVVAAAVWAGGSAAVLALGYYVRSRDMSARVEYTRMTEWLGPRFFAPASILVIVAGPLLASDADYDFGALWITLGFIGWTISFLFGVGFYGPEGKRREKAIEEHGLEHALVQKSLNRVLTVASIDTLIILLVVVDMVVKPGA